MSDELLAFLRLSVYAPLFFKMGSERKLTKIDRTILKLAGVATIAYNGYMLWSAYKTNVTTPAQGA